MMLRILGVLVVLLAPVLAPAEDDPDFFLKSRECSVVVATLAGGPLKSTPGDNMDFLCFRKSDAVTCYMAPAGTAKEQEPVAIELRVNVDSPPFLVLAGKNMGDFFMIETSAHTFVSHTRVMSVDGILSKTCRGSFKTTFELKASEKKFAK